MSPNFEPVDLAFLAVDAEGLCNGSAQEVFLPALRLISAPRSMKQNMHGFAWLTCFMVQGITDIGDTPAREEPSAA